VKSSQLTVWPTGAGVFGHPLHPPSLRSGLHVGLKRGGGTLVPMTATRR